MNRSLFWFADEEWRDYKIKVSVLQQQYPDCELKFSNYGYECDSEEFGYCADAIIAQVYVQIPVSAIQRLENYKGIAMLGGGYDRIDIKAAHAEGIGVTNAQGYCVEDLVDHILTVISHSYRSLTFYHDNLKGGEWGAQTAVWVSHRISHSTLFMIGCGRIDSTVAKRCQDLGMEVITYDLSRSGEALRKLDIEPVTMGEGLRQADYASLNVKLGENATSLTGEREFSLMRPTVYFINTARGAIVKEKELIEALENHVIAGVAVDAVTHESPREQELIFNTPNCIITPHVPHISQKSFEGLYNRAAQDTIRMLRGERPGGLVN